jgi:uncharacterized protein YceK
VKKSVIALSVVLGLSGCGVMQQYQQQKQTQAQLDLNARGDSEMKEVTERCVSIYRTDSRLDPLRSHVPLGSKDIPVDMLASTKKPTSKEKQAILAWDEIVTNCGNDRIAILKKYNTDQQVIANTESYYDQQKSLKVQLWSGKLTYGQYLNAVKENQRLTKANQNVINEKIQQRQQQAQIQQAQINAMNAQASAAVMSAQAQQLSVNAQTMMMFNQAQQQQRKQFNAAGSTANPVQTNCTRMGESVNCRTYSY